MQTAPLHFSRASSGQCGWASVEVARAGVHQPCCAGCVCLFWQRAFVPRCLCLRSSLVAMGIVASVGKVSGSLHRHRSGLA